MYNVIQLSDHTKEFKLDSFITESSDQFYTEAVFANGKKKLEPIVECVQAVKDKLSQAITDQTEDTKDLQNAYEKWKQSGEGTYNTKIRKFDPEKFWKDESWKKLEDCIQKVFGFRMVQIQPLKDDTYDVKDKNFKSKYMNAWVYRKVRYPIEGLVTDDGFYDKTKSIDLDINLTLGLLNALTAEEFVGVLLHEFGHAIDPALVDIRYTGTNILTKYITDRKGMINKEEQRAINEGKNKSAFGPEMLIVIPYLIMLGTLFITGIVEFFKWIVYKIQGKDYVQEKRLKKIQELIREDKVKFSRQEYSEAFADNFARMYGYGPALASGLKKMDKDAEKSMDSWITFEREREKWIWIITAATIKDVHKTDVHRIKALINEYKEDINNPDIPKKVKDQLKDDLKELEVILDQYMNDFSDFQNRVNKLISDELDKMDDENKEKSITESAKHAIKKSFHGDLKKRFKIPENKGGKRSFVISKPADKNDNASLKKKIKEAKVKLKKDTEKKSIRLIPGTPSKTDDPSKRTKTKIGGIPYWPSNMKWPTFKSSVTHIGKEGKRETINEIPMLCIAQLNFSELPKLDGFPSSGILQFFVEDVTDEKGKVVYHERIDTNNMTQDIPRHSLKRPEWEDIYSVETDLDLSVWYPKAGIVKQGINATYDSYTEKLTNTLNAMFGTHYTPKEISDCLWDMIHEDGNIYEDDNNIGCRISGYAYFVQGDDVDDSEEMLIQIDSESTICLGDSGSLQFFIPKSDLHNKKFDNAHMKFSCC